MSIGSVFRSWIRGREDRPAPSSPAIEALDTLAHDTELTRAQTLARHQRPSFSQLGEDGTLAWLFAEKRQGFYVDIGAYHPFLYSNTALLHHYHGWSGINVDMDASAIAAFDESRPDDRNIVAAIGRESGELEATFFTVSTEMNCIGKPNDYSSQFPHVFRTVNVSTLSSFLDRFLPPEQTIDFLNIDVEGKDYEVLASNDWDRYQPDVIAVEMHGVDFLHLSSQPIFDFLTKKGYALISHTVVTSIYRKSQA